jgi:hypothetical protein
MSSWNECCHTPAVAVVPISLSYPPPGPGEQRAPFLRFNIIEWFRSRRLRDIDADLQVA